ncbi:MAG: hypothetical protein V8S99_01510 [Oscillospiraceae bacterium]
MFLLVARNLAAGAAAAFFLASFALADIHKLLRAIAYFCGAGAYVAEILILTDGFRRARCRRRSCSWPIALARCTSCSA